jgi:nucleoside-diphosphate-sugar epimerase
MRVLVTGHNGYIGSVMVPVLQMAGHETVGLDTYLFEQCTLFNGCHRVPAVRKDARDITVKDLIGFEGIVHLAALCNDPLGDLNPDWTDEINFKTSLRLATLAKEAGVRRFIYASSCSMYGAAGDDVLTEDAPLKPLTAYAASKAHTEEHVSKLADKNFCPVYMRNATAYGVSPRLRADVVLNNLVCWAFTTGKVKILSDGKAWRPIVHVEDIARACAAILAAPTPMVNNRAFNVGVNGENYQVRDLAQIVKETVPGCTVEICGESGADSRNYQVDFSKIAKTLDFKPKWNARLGAAELYDTFQKVALTQEEFLGGKFSRLTQLKILLDSNRLDNNLRWTNETH